MWSIVVAEHSMTNIANVGAAGDIGGQSQQREAEGPLSHTVKVVTDARSVHVMGERLRESVGCAASVMAVSVCVAEARLVC